MDNVMLKDFQVEQISAKQKATVFNALFSMQKVAVNVLDSLKAVIHVLEFQWEPPRARVEWWAELIDENANANTISSYVRACVTEDILKIILQVEKSNGIGLELFDNCDVDADREELRFALEDIERIFDAGKKILVLDQKMQENFNSKYFNCDGKELLQDYKNSKFLKQSVKAREEGKVVKGVKQLLIDSTQELTNEIIEEYLQLLAEYSTLKWQIQRRASGLKLLFGDLFKCENERSEILQDWEALELIYQAAVRLKEDCRYFVNTKEDEQECIANVRKKVCEDYDKFLYVNKELFERYLSLMNQYNSYEALLEEIVQIDFEKVRMEFAKTKRHKVEHEKDDWFVFVQTKIQLWMQELEQVTIEG